MIPRVVADYKGLLNGMHVYVLLPNYAGACSGPSLVLTPEQWKQKSIELIEAGAELDAVEVDRG